MDVKHKLKKQSQDKFAITKIRKMPKNTLGD